jgi:hypothetical protein
MGRSLRIAAVALALILSLTLPAQGADPDLIRNGSFEEGFSNGVGIGWGSFNNGGHCTYGYHQDTWAPVVWDGTSSQLLSIQTGGSNEQDRYTGIYQTVAVVPGATYRLTIHGMVRSSEGSLQASGYGYRVQWAIDYAGGTDWTRVEAGAWQELPWYEWPLQSSGYLETFSTEVKARGDRLTLFIRAWRKWGVPNQEADFNLDGISLVGPAPAAQTTPTPEAGGQLPQTGVGMVAPVAGLLLLGLALCTRALRRTGT